MSRRRAGRERRELLDAYRAHHDYGQQRADAAWHGLQRRLAAGEDPPLTPAPSPKRWRPSTWIATLAVTAAAAALVVVWAGETLPWTVDGGQEPPRSQASFEAAGASASGSYGEVHRNAPSRTGSNRSEDGSSPPLAADAEPPARAESPEGLPDPPGSADPPRQASPKQVRRAPTQPAAAPAAPASAEPIGAPPLSRELELLRRAQGALARSAPAEALEHLRSHAREFADGTLAPERQGLRAIALCLLQDPAGVALGRRFLAAHPTSALRTRVHAACQDKSEHEPSGSKQIPPAPHK